jgi:hypothetical protein
LRSNGWGLWEQSKRRAKPNRMRTCSDSPKVEPLYSDPGFGTPVSDPVSRSIIAVLLQSYLGADAWKPPNSPARAK